MEGGAPPARAGSAMFYNNWISPEQATIVLERCVGVTKLRGMSDITKVSLLRLVDGAVSGTAPLNAATLIAGKPLVVLAIRRPG